MIRINRQASLTLDPGRVCILRFRRTTGSRYSRYKLDKLSAATISRLNRVIQVGTPSLMAGLDGYSMNVHIRANWSPDYQTYLERAIEARAIKHLTFDEYLVAERTLEKAIEPMRTYYADLLFVEERINE